MIDMPVSAPATDPGASGRDETAVSALKAVHEALRTTFAPFMIIPDEWGVLLDRLDR
jgi:hypothetical protein